MLILETAEPAGLRPRPEKAIANLYILHPGC